MCGGGGFRRWDPVEAGRWPGWGGGRAFARDAEVLRGTFRASYGGIIGGVPRKAGPPSNLRNDMEKGVKKLALVAHDNMKRDLAEWVAWNSRKLSGHRLVCTGTTGRMVADTLRKHFVAMADEEAMPALEITLLKSGPLGGDQQLGAMIAEGGISSLIFFWDPMAAQPHDVDVKALLRLATLYNVPTAINRSSADILISSPLFDDDDYEPAIKDYRAYVERKLK